MIHSTRKFKIADVPTFAELADKITQNSWVLCAGFRCGGLLCLNDSFSEDSAQEYAIIRNGTQVESLTVSWMKQERLAEILEKLSADPGYGCEMGAFDVLEHAPGSCPLCA